MLPYDGYILQEPGPSGYELDERFGSFSILSPEYRVNLFVNPNFEDGTTGATAVGAGTTIVASLAAAFRGILGLAITPGAGVTCGAYFSVTPTVSSVNYAYSLDVQGAQGVWYSLYVTDGAAATLSRVKRFRATGYWQRIDLLYNEGAVAARRFYLTRDTGSTSVFYVDCLQCEQGDYPTTYFDGSSKGYIVGQQAYYWTGRANASTSVRIANTGSGGRDVFLKDLGLKLLGAVGMGLPGYGYAATPMASGGEMFQKANVKARDFTLVFAMFADTQEQMMRQLNEVSRTFVPPQLQTDQEITLRYHRIDVNGNELQPIVEMPCRYISGLEEMANNPVQVRLGISMRAPTPYWAEPGQQSPAQLVTKDVLANAAYIAYYKDGIWSKLSTGFNGYIRPNGMCEDKAGRIWIGGLYTTAAGAAANRFCYWDPSTGAFVIPGTGADNNVLATMYFAEKNQVYFAGVFANVNGAANPWVAVYNIDAGTYSVIGGAGANTATDVRAIVRDRQGYVYFGGNFTQLRGVAAAYFIRYNPDTNIFTDVLSTLNGAVRSMAASPDGTKIYVAGNFTAPGVRFALYNTLSGTWVYGPSITGIGTWDVNKIVVGKQGEIYVSCSCAGIGNSPDYLVWKCTGGNFVGIMNVDGADVSSIQSLTIGSTGELVVAGNNFRKLVFKDLVGSDIAYGYGEKSIFYEFPGRVISTPVTAAFTDSKGGTYFSFATSDHILQAKQTALTITDSMLPQTKIYIVGPGTLAFLKINNLRMFQAWMKITPNELVTLSFTNGSVTAESNVRGNLNKFISPGMSGYQFFAYGNNTITALMLADYYEQNDQLDQIDNWDYLTGITPANSDNGKLYINVVVVVAGTTWRLDMFSNSARTTLVAHTADFTALGWQAVVPDGASGLAGYVYINSAAWAADVDIVVQFGIVTMTRTQVYRSLTEVIR